MLLTTLSAVERAIRASWCLWTADPADHAKWSEENPSSGQCAVTALVVQDLLGGGLIESDVRRADGTGGGYHYWNRLVGGAELDLTREQFTLGQRVIDARPVERASDVTHGRLAGQYHLLAARVRRALAGTPEPPAPEVRLVGVCLDHGTERPLMHRHGSGGDWELPGGCPVPGERFDTTLERAFGERVALDVEARHVVAAVCGGAGESLVVYECLRRP